MYVSNNNVVHFSLSWYNKYLTSIRLVVFRSMHDAFQKITFYFFNVRKAIQVYS